MKVLDGEKLAEKMLASLKNKVKEKNLRLKVAVILVGESDVSKSYIYKKRDACENTRINFELLNFPPSVREDELINAIKKLAEDISISGIVIQLPLPKNLDTQKILNLIPIDKDIDVLSELAFRKFSSSKSKILPPVVGAINELLKENGINLEGKKVAVIGKGRLVGKPVISWLEAMNYNFEAADKNTPDISQITSSADIIISGVGVPGLIKADMVKNGVVLIDAGTASEDGRVTGDIDKGAYDNASFVSPVPGGVGPMTIACLVKNLVDLNS